MLNKIEKQRLEDLRETIDSLTARKTVTRRKDERMEHFLGFLQGRSANIRY